MNHTTKTLQFGLLNPNQRRYKTCLDNYGNPVFVERSQFVWIANDVTGTAHANNQNPTDAG